MIQSGIDPYYAGQVAFWSCQFYRRAADKDWQRGWTDAAEEASRFLRDHRTEITNTLLSSPSSVGPALDCDDQCGVSERRSTVEAANDGL